jgi:hypothetical protein
VSFKVASNIKQQMVKFDMKNVKTIEYPRTITSNAIEELQASLKDW